MQFSKNEWMRSPKLLGSRYSHDWSSSLNPGGFLAGTQKNDIMVMHVLIGWPHIISVIKVFTITHVWTSAFPTKSYH